MNNIVWGHFSGWSSTAPRFSVPFFKKIISNVYPHPSEATNIALGGLHVETSTKLIKPLTKNYQSLPNIYSKPTETIQFSGVSKTLINRRLNGPSWGGIIEKQLETTAAPQAKASHDEIKPIQQHSGSHILDLLQFPGYLQGQPPWRAHYKNQD